MAPRSERRSKRMAYTKICGKFERDIEGARPRMIAIVRVLILLPLMFLLGCDAKPESREQATTDTAHATSRAHKTEIPATDFSSKSPSKPVAPAATDATSPLGCVIVDVVSARTRSPMPGIRCSIGPRGALIDRDGEHTKVSGLDGRVVFEHLPPGRTWIMSHRRRPDQPVNVRAGRTAREVLEIDEPTRDKRRVVGFAVDEKLLPIADAEIVLIDRSPFDGFSSVVRSDASGRFEIAWPDFSRQVAVRADGYFDGDVLSDETIDRLQRQGLRPTLRLRRGAGTVEGIIVDRSGIPVRSAEVRIGDVSELWQSPWDPRPAPKLAATFLVTDAGGRFACRTLAPGRHPIAVRRAGFGHYGGTIEIPAEPSAPQTIVLSPEAVVSGRVTFKSGRPAARMTVTTRHEDLFFRRFAETDADGRYLISCLSEGPVGLVVEVPHGVSKSKSMPVRSGEAIVWNPVLDDGLAIKGTVKDEAGTPIRGAIVRAYEPNDGYFPFAGEARTDELGSFEIFGLEDRRYNLHVFVEEDAMPAKIVRLQKSDETDVRVVARVDGATSRISGRILDRRDQPIADACVRIVTSVPDVSLATSSDRAGVFEIRGLSRDIEGFVITTDAFPMVLIRLQKLAVAESRQLGDIRLPDPGTIILEFPSAKEAAEIADRLSLLDADSLEAVARRRIDGRTIVFSRLSSGRYRIHVDKETSRRPPIVLAEGAIVVIPWAQ